MYRLVQGGSSNYRDDLYSINYFKTQHVQYIHHWSPVATSKCELSLHAQGNRTCEWLYASHGINAVERITPVPFALKAAFLVTIV